MTTRRPRVLALSSGLGLVAVALLVRLCDLQMIRAEEFQDKARIQHEGLFAIEGDRGSIADRNGRELAVSTETRSLFAHPTRVTDPAKAARLLSPVIDVPQGKILEKLRSKKSFVWLRRRLDPKVAAAVEELDLEVGAGHPFGFEVEGKRFYPQGSLAVHVVGFANIDQNGVEGIENIFDEELKGAPASYLVMRDGRGGAVLKLVHPPEKQPWDVVLTLDVVIQQIVERELDLAMSRTGALAASAILMDPSTGQILALANRPTADPNRYGDARPEGRRNRAVTDNYEPGSVFKIIPVAAALEEGVISASRRFDCERGSIRVAGHRIRDHKPHDILTVTEIIEKSSNVGCVKISRLLDKQAYFDSISAFGFGSQTGIELPGERSGLLSIPEKWSGLTAASLSIGQEIGVTALQMVTAVSAVANGGVLVPPRVVLGIREADGTIRPAPTREPRSVISPRTARTLTRMLAGVVERGTGKRAQVPGYHVAGKTGTAQKVKPTGGYSHADYMASFGGFAPAYRPRLAGIVVIDTPRGDQKYGGEVAAPVFANIMAEVLPYLRVPQDEDPAADEEDDGQRERIAIEEIVTLEPVPTVDGQVPDVRGLSLREAVVTLARRGYGTRVRGHGNVEAQSPAPGTPLAAGRTCNLKLSSERSSS